MKRISLVLIFVLCLAGLALAQTDTARLIGTITDSTGAVIPNARSDRHRYRNRAYDHGSDQRLRRIHTECAFSGEISHRSETAQF